MSDQLDLSGLRAHVRAMHPRMPMRRATADLSREHARQHHRLVCSHTHGPVASEDNTGPLAGTSMSLLSTLCASYRWSPYLPRAMTTGITYTWQ